MYELTESINIEPVSGHEEKVELPVLYEHAWYSVDECEVRVIAGEDEAWGELSFEMDCTGPPSNHWLSYCLEGYGFSDVIGVEHDITRFLMEHGIAPDQPFYLWMRFRSWRDYWGEYDEEIDCEVRGVVPWDKERVTTAWEAFYGRKYLMVFG